MIKVGIIGASGYTGEKISNLLENHKKAKLEMVCSTSHVGKKVSELFPKTKSDLVFSEIDFEKLNKMDCVFLAVPHGEAKKIAEKINSKIIDLSADHRSTHVYGLSDVFKNDLFGVKLIANPGCYATACLLGAWPMKDQIETIAFDCISGYSGGGKTNKYDFEENIMAYNLTNHFHKKEILEQIGLDISFVPHVVNAFNGLMSTVHIKLKEEIKKEEIFEKYSKLYANSFTSILDSVPCTKEVINTPQCKIGFEVSGKELVVVSVIDNLMKGSSSQAIENMNLMFGFNQKEGLC